MPIYEYECKHCHHQFERMQKISDTPITECPECHNETATRLVSASGFQLKGTGWYVTDFKNKKDTKKETTSTTEASTEKKSTETSSDSKKE